MENDAQRRLQHARGLERQGQLLRATDNKATYIWSSAVQQLPSLVLSFSLNAAQEHAHRMQQKLVNANKAGEY